MAKANFPESVPPSQPCFSRGASSSQLSVCIDDSWKEDNAHAWKARFEITAQASENIIYEWNPITRRTTLSPAFQRLTGHSPDEASDHTAAFLRWMHPQDRQTFQDAFVRLLTRNLPFQIEYRISKKNGDMIYLQDTAQALVNSSGVFKRLVGIMADITDRKISEARLRSMNERLRAYRALIESTGAGYLALSPKGLILDANIGCARLLGWSDPEELRGQDLFQWTVPEDQPLLRRELEGLTKGGEPRNFRIRQTSEDRRRITLEINASRYESSAGLQILTLCQDLTERLAREREYHQTQRLQALGTLAGGVAHDFNNILTAVMGFSDLIRVVSGDTSQVSEFAREIEVAAERGRRLVKQILAFVRSMETVRNPIALGPILQDAARLVRATLPSHMEIVLKLDPEAESELVRADSVQIHQVVMNLCANSVHAMRRTGGTLTILLENDVDSNANKRLRLSIIDTGVGMTAEVQEHIFDPFFTTNSTGEGAGLGLSMAHGIISSHRGLIEVESEIGQGSAFRLLLPVAQQITESSPCLLDSDDEILSDLAMSADDEESAACDFGVGPNADESEQKPRILVVDDELIVLNLFKTALDAFNYQVFSYGDPKEALAAVQADPARFDAILTDMTMPSMSGVELAKAIRELRPDIPIILMSGHDEAPTSDALANIHFDSFLMKPVKIDDLDRAIRIVLD